MKGAPRRLVIVYMLDSAPLKLLLMKTFLFRAKTLPSLTEDPLVLPSLCSDCSTRPGHTIL